MKYKKTLGIKPEKRNPIVESVQIKPTTGGYLDFNRDNLIKGIIYSEILGKPRSKRR